MDPAQAAAGHRVAGGTETGVEATLETDLNRHLAAGHALGDQPRAPQVRGERLLAERGEPRVQGTPDQLGVGAGGCADGHPIQVGPQQRADVGHGLEAELLGHGLGPRGIDVGDDDLFDVVQTLQRGSMKCPDPADSNQANAHAQTLQMLQATARGGLSLALTPPGVNNL